MATKLHKTGYTGVKRFFAFSEVETEILRRRCEGKGADEYVFSPREAMRKHWQRQAETRKTRVQPSQRPRARRREAGVILPDWTPYQPRHAAVTENSKKYGREVADLIAGHQSPSTMEIYEHKAESAADTAAKEREAWWVVNANLSGRK